MYVAHEIRRDKDLSSIGDSGDSRGTIHHGTEIIHSVGDRVFFAYWLAPVTSHANGQTTEDNVVVHVDHDSTLRLIKDLSRPFCFEQLVLAVETPEQGGSCGRESYHEGITLCLDLVATEDTKLSA